MTINFPSSPSIGDAVTAFGKTWEWNGTGWALQVTEGGAVTSVNGETGDVVLGASDVDAEPTIAAGTSSQFWRGDKTWQDVGSILPPGYIDGLQMQWVSGTALTITSGAAYIEGSGKVLRATANIAKTGLSLSASTWYHVYLYSNAGTPDFELSTTAPAAAYNGTARSKTGDGSRRYVGSIKTDSGGSMLRFSQNGDRIFYMADPATAPFRLLSAGSATTPTSIDLSVLLPTTSTFGMFKLTNFASNVTVVVGTPECSSLFNTIANSGLFVDCAVPSRSVSYYYPGTPSGGGAYFDVRGYVFER